jgi:hypothetical protein
MSRLKKTLWIITGISSGIFLLVSLLAWIYKDEVKNLVVNSLNKQLSAEVKTGDISFSILRHFPYISVDFTGVEAMEPKGFKTTGSVLKAEKLSLLFNFRSLFSKEYQLKKIVLKNASLNLQVDANGNTNYEIWKKENDTVPGDQFSLGLENVEMENVDVLYYHAGKEHDISFLVNKGQLSGDFSSDRYQLTAEAELVNAEVIIAKISYLAEANSSIKLGLEVDNVKGVYVFKESVATIKGMKLAVDGSISDPGEYLEIDLKVSSPEADLKSLLSLIPQKYIKNADGYNYDGDVEFMCSLKGKSDNIHTPLVNIDFRTTGAELNPKGTDYRLTKMNFKGFFTNRKSNSNAVTYLRLEKFRALLEGRPVEADITIENFNKPSLDISAKIDADLKVLSKFYKPDTLEDLAGKINADFRFSGVAGLKNTYKSEGAVKFSGVGFRIKHKPLKFENFQGNVRLDGNEMMVENVTGNAGKSDFLIDGTFFNLFSWALNDGQLLNIKASFKSSHLDLNELMAKENQTSEDTTYRLNFPPWLSFRLGIDIDKLSFRKFSADQILGNVSLDSKVLMTEQLAFNTVGGLVRLSGKIDDRPEDSLKIDYDADLENLDINRLFDEMGNFGQTVLTAANLKGRVNANVKFRSMWSDKLVVNQNRIEVSSDITIENGELYNFEPMLALSRYLKGADLKKIRFSTLTNTIRISNRNIIIPLMEIKSSALDLNASGTHNFDNMVDYRLRLYLSQIMGKKVKEQNTEFGTIEEDGYGRPMVYLTMKGPVSNPDFALDRRGVEQKITSEIKKEARGLKDLFREEFGTKDTSIRNPDRKEVPKKQQELEIDYEDEEE